MMKSKKHPVRRAVVVLQLWLIMVCTMMGWNSIVARGYLLHGYLRPLPFALLAVAALAWTARAWDVRVIIGSCSLIVVGAFLRGLEVLLFADDYDLGPRLTGMSLWWFTSGTTMAFGVLSLIAVSRRVAEEWVWQERSLSLG